MGVFFPTFRIIASQTLKHSSPSVRLINIKLSMFLVLVFLLSSFSGLVLLFTFCLPKSRS